MPVNLLVTEFPYYRYYVDPKFIKTVFKSFKTYIPKNRKLTHEKEEIFTVVVDYEKEKVYLSLSDYFTQEARMKAKFLDNPSPYDIFQEIRFEMNDKFGDGIHLYHEIYEWIWKRSKMCSNFPVTVIKSILDHYKPKRVFDPSAGWGDRMLACISKNIQYTGVDPNRNLVRGYQEMITILEADPSKHGLVTLPIEEYNLQGSKKPDMIITSPPFFNMEHYSVSPTQSEKRYPTYEVWKTSFLYSLLDRCYSYLEVGGHFIIYVNNIKKYNILDDTVFYMKNMEKKDMMRYEGYIGWVNTKHPKKLLVYRKLK